MLCDSLCQQHLHVGWKESHSVVISRHKADALQNVKAERGQNRESSIGNKSAARKTGIIQNQHPKAK